MRIEIAGRFVLVGASIVANVQEVIMDEFHFPFGFMPTTGVGEVLLLRLVGIEPFTAISIHSLFHNPVNPPILLL